MIDQGDHLRLELRARDVPDLDMWAAERNGDLLEIEFGRRIEPVTSAAADVTSVADALGIEQFAVIGHSAGAAHALACAALLPERVLAAVCASGLAPYHAQGLDWFAGMGAAGAAELRAAASGRAALEEHLASAEYDPELFIPADHAALAGAWSWLLSVVEQAMEGGLGGMVDDDLACVAPWGFDPGQVRGPVLFLHGARIGWCPPRTASGWPAGPFGGAVAAPGRRTHLGPGCRRGGPGLAVGARPPGLTRARGQASHSRWPGDGRSCRRRPARSRPAASSRTRTASRA